MIITEREQIDQIVEMLYDKGYKVESKCRYGTWRVVATKDTHKLTGINESELMAYLEVYMYFTALSHITERCQALKRGE